MSIQSKNTISFQKLMQLRVLLPAQRDTSAILLLTIALAFCIKLFYSTAGPTELKWILAPTTVLVNAFSSIHFLFETNKGYVATGIPVVIGPGCAGLNFFVIALCMCVFSFIDRFKKHKLYVFLALVVLTYIVTVFANASRIVVGLMLLELSGSMNLAVTDTMHATQGTLFYFFFLMVYFVAMRALLDGRDNNETIY